MNPNVTVPNINNPDLISSDNGVPTLWGNLAEGLFGIKNNYSDRAQDERSAEIATARQFALNEDAYNKSVKLQDMQNSFQERMSSTAIQRQMADAKKAGINPLLMFGQPGNGASSPVGSATTVSAGSAKGPSAHGKTNGVSDLIGGALKFIGLLSLFG